MKNRVFQMPIRVFKCQKMYRKTQQIKTNCIVKTIKKGKSKQKTPPKAGGVHGGVRGI